MRPRITKYIYVCIILYLAFWLVSSTILKYNKLQSVDQTTHRVQLHDFAAPFIYNMHRPFRTTQVPRQQGSQQRSTPLIPARMSGLFVVDTIN